MPEIVVDTNVLVVAEGKHGEASPECVLACMEQLQSAMDSGTVVIDDGFRVLSEYQKNLNPRHGKGAGSAFLKWLFQNQTNTRAVAQVTITEIKPDQFAEFPVTSLEKAFDPSDRKFPAIANRHPGKPPILQATDSKWLHWWRDLAATGIKVEFLCPEDICRFHKSKFPKEPAPHLP